jgi:uncharacterized protein YjbI with pentapeptide repeats
LPFLDVELPLLGFFVLGPLLFLVLHAYVLLHFAMFADKVGVFHSELQAQIKDEGIRTRLRRQLPSDIFVQYLAGPYEVRTGIMGFMLRLIALITLVIFPITLLVFFQLQFLPYHDAPITWWLRVAVLLDILLLWTLWPSIARGQASWISWHDFRRPRIIAFLFASLVPLLLVFTIATFPGEWLDSKLPSLPLVPTHLPSSKSGSTDQPQASLEERWLKVIDFAKAMEWTSLHDLLVAGDVDFIARKPKSLWSNRLVLPGIDVIDHATFDSEEKIEASREALSLRGRHLERAVLIGSDLGKTDLTAARLEGAVLVRADLREAKFCEAEMEGEQEQEQDCAQLQSAILIGANLQGANLQRANLQGAHLQQADLQGANLQQAQLQGADLRRGKLQGADLTEAKLQGADLRQANLQGAHLNVAQLQGADLRKGKLQGAILMGTYLQGAKLKQTNLQGANLQRADLQGADLSAAKLQGADLTEAKLQGADLGAAELQGANLELAQLQGANLAFANLQGADLTDSHVWLASFSGSGLEPPVLGVATMNMSPLTAADKADLTEKLNADITDGELLKEVLDTLNPILRKDPEKWDDEDKWRRFIEQGHQPAPDVIAGFLAHIACEEPEGHIALVIAEKTKNVSRDYAKPLAKLLLSDTCEGAKALTKETRASLEKLGAE